MIVFEGATKRFSAPGRPDFSAVDGVDLSIAQGEVFGVIGPSGAGKSTLLRLVNGLERPSAGRVTVAGAEVGALRPAELKALRRRIGMIFQSFGLLSSKTAAENIAFPLRLAGDMGRAAIGARTADLLARVGLGEHSAKYPAQLSGGQKQRVGVARALATGPDILLCDEATSALDPESTRGVLALLAALNRELGLTIVLITHEIDVIRRVCDRVAVMDAGRIVETGPAADVLLHPAHAVTRRLISETDAQGDEAAAAAAPAGARVVRLTYRGEVAYQPFLARAARDAGVDFSILSGRISRIKDTPYGQLTVALMGEGAERAIAAFRRDRVQVDAA